MWLLCDDHVCDWKGLPGSSARGILWHLMGRNKSGLLLESWQKCILWIYSIFDEPNAPNSNGWVLFLIVTVVYFFFFSFNPLLCHSHPLSSLSLSLVQLSCPLLLLLHLHLLLLQVLVCSHSVSLCEWLNAVKLASVDRRAHTKGHRLVRDDHGRHEEWSRRCLDSLYGALQCDVSCLHSGKECLFQLKGDGLLHDKEMWWDLW